MVAVAATGRSRGNESRLAQLAEVVRDEQLAHPRHLLELTHRTGANRKPERDQQSFIRKRAQDRRPGNRDRSALIGYGLDSSIEGIASIVIIWRFTGHRIHANHAETRAQKVVALSLFLLAPYIIVGALDRLLTSQEPQPSWVGIGLAIVSIALMPIFGRAKKRLRNQLQYAATEQGDAFYEPANVAIAHFDNASDHDSVAFVACYLLPPGEARLIEMLSSPTTG